MVTENMAVGVGGVIPCGVACVCVMWMFCGVFVCFVFCGCVHVHRYIHAYYAFV